MGSCIAEGKSGGQKVESELEKEQPDWGGKVQTLKKGISEKPEQQPDIIYFPLDKNAVRTSLRAETSDLCYSGEKGKGQVQGLDHRMSSRTVRT